MELIRGLTAKQWRYPPALVPVTREDAAGAGFTAVTEEAAFCSWCEVLHPAPEADAGGPIRARRCGPLSLTDDRWAPGALPEVPKRPHPIY